MTGGIRLFLCGDSILQHPLDADVHVARAALRSVALGCDLGISNLECNIQTGENWPAYVAGQGRGTTYMAAPPAVLNDLLDFGIRAVFTANNHSVDFGELGVQTTIRYLDAAGIAHAGTGSSLAEASAGCLVDTPAGRVAVIGASDWGPRGLTDLSFPWPMGVLASDGDAVFSPRPGANLLRYQGRVHVDEQALAELRRISAALGWEEAKRIRNQGGGRSEPLTGTSVFDQECDSPDVFHFMGRAYVASQEFSFETRAFDEDIDRNCRAVQAARQEADYVIVGVHQQGASRSETTPPDHTVQFARAAIDAGADLFAAHGRARAGGVEIYHGRPILYGLPGFINHLDKVPAVPVEQKRRWGLADDAPAGEFIQRRRHAEGASRTAIGRGGGDFLPMVAVTAELGAARGELTFYPFQLVDEGRPSELGEPRLLGAGALANRTLELVGDRVLGLGTDFIVADGVGTVRFGTPE